MSNRRQRSPHGRRIRCPGSYLAYIPDPLPPPIVWSTKLVAVLSAADRAVGRLAGEGRRLPNPHILIRLAERLDVAFTTAQRTIDRLESNGIVALAGEAKRNRVYCARALLSILEEPPQLLRNRHRAG